MDLQLSDEQEAFVATTRRFLDAECPISATRALEHDPDGFDRGVWRRGAELGWTSLLVPEADGGGSLSEHGLFDLVLVAEEMGRLVAPGPLGPVSVVADAVGRLGTPEQRSEVLPGLLDGSQVAAWCGPQHVDGRRRSAGRLELPGTWPPLAAPPTAPQPAGAVAKLSLNLSGTGRIVAAGRAATLAIDASGTGHVDTSTLVAGALSVQASGTGAVRAQVNGPAAIDASGLARVTVTGRPNCSTSKSGLARVTCG